MDTTTHAHRPTAALMTTARLPPVPFATAADLSDPGTWSDRLRPWVCGQLRDWLARDRHLMSPTKQGRVMRLVERIDAGETLQDQADLAHLDQAFEAVTEEEDLVGAGGPIEQQNARMLVMMAQRVARQPTGAGAGRV